MSDIYHIQTNIDSIAELHEFKNWIDENFVYATHVDMHGMYEVHGRLDALRFMARWGNDR